ncbi:MAG: rhodanese-like domain-containing protein [Thermodesulfobacteriota bacterium]
MNWRNLLSPVRDLSPEEAREFMAARKAGEFQLLDVRQPKEYEEGHLAGSVLIPIKELPARLQELEAGKPTLVYCAVGGRSKAAAQYLAGMDFASVYNLRGGIKAWQGEQARGPEEAGLLLLSAEAEFEDGLSLAYAMENGLQRFYLLLAERSADETLQSLYRRLSGFEDLHKARLLGEYRQEYGRDSQLAAEPAEVMEGGHELGVLLAQAEAGVKDRRDVLELAMALETQALDLYSRLARRAGRQDLADFFLRLADEENQHLAFLAAELDKLL